MIRDDKDNYQMGCNLSLYGIYGLGGDAQQESVTVAYPNASRGLPAALKSFATRHAVDDNKL
eukprot:880495-Amphidinium_carterae.1